MSHSSPTNPARYPAEIVFSDFKVTGLCQYGPVLKKKFPRTCIKVLVGSSQPEQTEIAPRGPDAQWNNSFTFAATKPDEQVTVMLLQVPKDSAPVCLASYSGTVAKLGPSQEFTMVLQTQKKYSVTLSFKYHNISNADHPHARVFALIIGINQYKFKDPLEGSVRDATEFRNYLSSDLEVPDANIRFLTDRAATREQIIDGFRWLTEHPRINVGDAIIVYYAGHGSRAPAPDGWFAEGGKVETICPIDEQEFKHGKRVHGIPDRTIGGLLKRLSDKKGDNITVIFDCCHSGGLSRGVSTDTNQPTKLGRARHAAPSPYPMPADLDKDIWDYVGTRAATIAKVDYGIRQAPASYVLLAACRPDERAWETLNQNQEACGAFSNSLIRNLRLVQEDTTYADLLERMTGELSTFQYPQCEGKNKTRGLFNGRGPKKDPNAYTLKIRDDDGEFEVAVGEIHGLCPGAILSCRIFDPDTGAYREIGQLEAKDVLPQKSILRRIPGAEHFDVWFGTKVVVKTWNSSDFSLPVFIEDEPASEPITIGSSPDHEPRFRKVAKKSDAEVVVRRTGPGSAMVTFDRIKSPIAEHANLSPRKSIPYSPEKLEETLDAISHFHHHLGRSNPKTTIKPDDIRIHCHLLKEVDTVNAIYAIDGDDLMKDGEAVIPPSSDRWYGFTIENRTQYDLYPYLFWFDPAEYTVELWYEPHSLTMAPPLPRAQLTRDGIKPTSFGIGYGSSTTDPFEFSLAPGEKRDTGFLKLYVSTRCVEMNFIEQASPLGEGFARSSKTGPTATRQVKREEMNEMWETFIARVVVSEDA